MMMKKEVLIVFLLIFLVVFGFNLFKSKIGDIRPALLPPVNIENRVERISTFKKENTEIKGIRLENDDDLPLKIPSGYNIQLFAQNLGNARDLEFSPKGTLLVSIPNDNKIVALSDRNSDYKADRIEDVLTDLDRPHGISFYNNKLFVAEEKRIARYNFDEETYRASLDKVLFLLPAGGRHFTRTIAFTREGKMFVSIGSTCDVCFEDNPWIGGVIVSNFDGDDPRLYARGLRNSVFITINPETDELWGTEMGRDFLGDDLPPDEINIIRDQKDYGWPLCFGNRVHDKNFDKRVYKRSPCIDTEPPVYEIAAHSSPLGLVFIDSSQFADSFQGDLLVAYHGSWNRSTPIGYKVVKMKINDSKIIEVKDFITGFLKDSTSFGRPVDIDFDIQGNLYLSDDKRGVVYVMVRN